MPLGAKNHSYNLVENWAKLPATVQLGYTHWVACDKKDQVYVFNQSKDAVAIFSKDGTFLKSWGEEFAKGAHGMWYSVENGTEYLYLCDYEIPVVAKFTLDGTEVLRLKTPPLPEIYPAGAGYKPTHVCVGPNGDIYTFDGYGKNYIHRYNAKGVHLNSWGGEGEGTGQMKCPHGGCIVVRPGKPAELYVADRANVRVQVFTPEGVHKRFITGQGLQYPCNVYEAHGDVYIPDLFGVVTIWGPDDTLITQLGANPEIPEIGGWPKLAGYPNLPHEQRIPGRFISPHGLGIDSRRDLYVVEWVSDGRITKLAKVAAEQRGAAKS